MLYELFIKHDISVVIKTGLEGHCNGLASVTVQDKENSELQYRYEYELKMLKVRSVVSYHDITKGVLKIAALRLRI